MLIVILHIQPNVEGLVAFTTDRFFTRCILCDRSQVFALYMPPIHKQLRKTSSSFCTKYCMCIRATSSRVWCYTSTRRLSSRLHHFPHISTMIPEKRAASFHYAIRSKAYSLTNSPWLRWKYPQGPFTHRTSCVSSKVAV